MLKSTPPGIKVYEPTALDWQVLQVYNCYRCFLACTLLLLRAFDVSLLGRMNVELFIYTLIPYLGVSIPFTAYAFLRNADYNSQVILQIFLDILVITFLMHASGGVLSGLGVLLIPVIAAASVLAPGKISYLYTAMATIALLSEQLFALVHQSFENISFTVTGLSGITLFATAAMVNALARQLTKSTELSRQQTAALAKLEKLAIQIFQKIHPGVLVVNENNQLTMSNHAANTMLNYRNLGYNTQIEHFSIPLLNALNDWRSNKLRQNPIQLQLTTHFSDVSVEFVTLEQGNAGSVLIFLEDLSKQSKKVREMKLASIGRLTANIAHEIRNPLGAISHAAQLLSESANLKDSDRRLLTIVQDNSRRTNQIIENILTLSRAKTTDQKSILLKEWLEKFTGQFVMKEYDKLEILLDIRDPKIKILMDPTQMHQVITNLCENGIRYSMQKIQSPYLKLVAGLEHNQAFLDIIDKGTGISEVNEKYLFEPFFTTEHNGTGLGLFVAQELCQANGSKLEYFSMPEGGARFRITFVTLKEIK